MKALSLGVLQGSANQTLPSFRDRRREMSACGWCLGMPSFQMRHCCDLTVCVSLVLLLCHWLFIIATSSSNHLFCFTHDMCDTLACLPRHYLCLCHDLRANNTNYLDIIIVSDVSQLETHWPYISLIIYFRNVDYGVVYPLKCVVFAAPFHVKPVRDVNCWSVGDCMFGIWCLGHFSVIALLICAGFSIEE